MHTVELLEQALEAARGLGYVVRYDWLGGEGSGYCTLQGRKWLLLDLAQSPEEQLEAIAGAFGEESQAGASPELIQWLATARAA